MAKLIHSATLANFQSLFPDWENSTSSVYKSVVFTDDGYIYTHGKAFRVPLAGDTTQGLTEFIRDGFKNISLGLPNFLLALKLFTLPRLLT